VVPALRREPSRIWIDWSTNFIGGVTFLGEVTRNAPVRTEPHPTSPRHPALRREPPRNVGSIGRPIPLGVTSWARQRGGPALRREPSRIWVDWRPISLGGDILRRGQAESPGSDGASPYQPASSCITAEPETASEDASLTPPKYSILHFLCCLRV
jgi:hypothetical protein